MRARPIVFLMALTALAAPAAAHAAVPVGPAGELRPRTGAELVEAADGTAGIGSLQNGAGQRIVLGEATYEVGRPIVLGPGSHLEGEGAGTSRIVGNGSTTTLLRIGAGATASGFSLQGRGEDASAFSLIELRGSARLSESYVFVPDSLPRATAATLTGAGNVIGAMEIESEALAPAVRAAAGSEISGGSSITGGAPALVLTGGSDPATTTLSRTIVQGSGDATSVVTAEAASAPLTVRLQSAQIRGGAESAALLDLLGASTRPGSLAVDLQSSTIIGAAGSTAIRVQPGAESEPTIVDLAGLLSLGSETALDCLAGSSSNAAPAAVRIAGIFRDGALASSSACAVTETGRRTGDPRFRDADARDYAPRWGSVLIDAVAAPSDHPTDATGGPRTSTGPSTPTATPTDIGTIEYAFTPPAIDSVTAAPADDQGLLSFTAEASDEDPDETAALRLTWAFPDGTTASGPTATWRARTAGPVTVTVTATDVSGIVRRAVVTATPVVPEPEPTTPTATQAPQQTLPETVTLPKPTPTTAPTITPGPQAPLTDPAATIIRFDRVGARTSARATRASGLGAARSGEASVQIETRRAAKVLFTVRRRVDGRDAIVSRARFSIAVPAGTTTVHLSSRFGPARLRPGLHRVVALVQAGSGIVERRELFVRVVR